MQGEELQTEENGNMSKPWPATRTDTSHDRQTLSVLHRWMHAQDQKQDYVGNLTPFVVAPLGFVLKAVC